MTQAERVQKIIAQSGLTSRRKAEEFIVAGKVLINGKRAKLGDKATTDDIITVDGKQIYKQSSYTIMLHKPVGYICTRETSKHKKTVYDLVPRNKGLFTIGRLDVGTEGLLVFTNQGDLAQRLTHPSYEVEKEYKVVLSRPFTDEHRKRTESGLMLRDERGQSYRAEGIKIQWNPEKPRVVHVIVHEGRYHFVRKIFAAFHYEIVRLIRIRVGSLMLGDLERGKWRELTKHDREKLTLS